MIKMAGLFDGVSIAQVNRILERNMTGLLDIRATEIQGDSIIATMPVTDKVRQPYGILHGGASVTLAESIGSVASNMIIEAERFMGVGLEVNANHLRPVIGGIVKAVCKPLHIGRKTHVWDIQIYDDQERLVCVSRLTVAIVAKS